MGLNLYEMDVRSYDPAIARFTTMDPVTHHSMSPFMAFDGNPVYWADPSGADSVGADGLTNDQWMELSRPGGGGFDAMRAQRNANNANNFEQSRNNSNSLTVGPVEELEGKEQDNSKKAQLYFNDIKKFLKRFAYNNAANVMSRKNPDKNYVVHIEGSVELNTFYATPFFSKDEGGLLDENFIRGFREKTSLPGYGKVLIIYQAGLEINDFNSSSDYIHDLGSIQGSPIELRDNKQTVGFILFESKLLRDNFLEDYYFSHFREAKEKMANEIFKDPNTFKN